MAVILPVKMQEMKESDHTFFIELYTIVLRDNSVIRLAATDEDITFGGNKYLAIPIQRQDIERSMDSIVNSCQLTIADADYGALAYIMQGFDFRGCNAIITRIQYPDSLSNSSIVHFVFGGFLDEPSYADGEFSVKIMSRFPEIECPNRTYQLPCNSSFGDSECTMSLATENIQITGVNGNVLNLAKSFSENYWKDGSVKVEGESRIVAKSSGNSITLNVNFLQANLVGKYATLNRGCNKTVARCREYGNLVHYGGFPAIPFESMYR